MTRKLLGSAAASTLTSKAPINFLAGWPNPTLLLPESLRAAANVVCREESIWTHALNYGPDDGYQPLREAVSTWLTDFYSLDKPLSADQICITGGASQNLACVLQVYSDPVYTRNIWLVSPTYFHACKIFDDAGFAGRLRAVPEDEEGIDIEYLADALRASEENALKAGNIQPKLKSPKPYRKIFMHFIYAVPTFSNPSGRLMSLARRQALVRLARQYDALIVTDDVYDMLQWPVSAKHNGLTYSDNESAALKHACLPRIVDIDATLDGGPIDEFGNAVSNGTFSKIVAPGCRTGWAQGTAKMAFGVGKAASSQSGGAPSQFTSTLIHQLLTTSKLQSHIFDTLQPAYCRRYCLMLDAIRAHLVPLGCTLISEPAKPTSSSKSTTTTTSEPGTAVNQKEEEEQQGIGGGYFHYFSLPEALVSSERASQQQETTTANHHQNTTGKTKSTTIADKIRILALEQENVRIMAGPLFRVDGDASETDHDRYAADIRLSFAWEAEDKIVEGVVRLAGVVESEMRHRGLL